MVWYLMWMLLYPWTLWTVILRSNSAITIPGQGQYLSQLHHCVSENNSPRKDINEISTRAHFPYQFKNSSMNPCGVCIIHLFPVARMMSFILCIVSITFRWHLYNCQPNNCSIITNISGNQIFYPVFNLCWPSDGIYRHEPDQRGSVALT